MKAFDVFESPDGIKRVEFRFFSNEEKTRFFGIMQHAPGKGLSEFWFNVSMLEGWKWVYSAENDNGRHLWARRTIEPAITPPEPTLTKNFTEAIQTMQHAVHENAKAHGWWDNPPEDGTVIMMIVRELSELVEELRIGGKESAKIDGFTSEEEELADAVLRILDFAGRKNYRLGAAILAKHEYNLGREYKHGGKLF